MDQHLIFLVLGLAGGAVYAALALTLVVTYRSSGVVNFATGAMSLLGAYLYAFLRRGELLLPLPFLPKTVDVGDPMGFWPAALISVAVCALVGLFLYAAVFRRLHAAPVVAKAVASIGLMVIFTGLFALRVGTTAEQVRPILPEGSWELGEVRISQDRVWFAVTVVAIALGLTAVYRFTRFGLLTRAAAETEKGAHVSGISPDRIAAANWMISAAVAAVSGILIAPIVPLTPFGYTFFIVPALAAAVIGNFQHMIVAVAGGLAIGMVQSELAYLNGEVSWLPTSGMAELVPLLLILIVFVARAKPLPSRGVIIHRTLGRAPRPRLIARPALIATAVAMIALVALQGPWRAALVTSLIFGVLSLSLVVVTGYCGQVSLAQLTLAGVAGFLLAPLTTGWQLPLVGWSIPFPLAPIVAALGATVVGVLVGLPALRIRGLPVAVVTLAFSVAIEALWFHNPDLVGIAGEEVVGPELFGLDLRARVGADFPRLSFAFLTLAVLVIVAVAVARLRQSRLGSEMLAVRANERSAAGAGVDVVRVKVLAFALGAFIAGLGGAMLAYFQGNVTFDAFTTVVGLVFFATTYIGGVTRVSGGIAAGLLAAGGMMATFWSNVLNLGEWYIVAAGLGLLFTVIRRPDGAFSPIYDWLDRRRLVAAAVEAPERTEASVSKPAPTRARARSVCGVVALETDELRVAYGGMVAVDDVSLTVPHGTVVGLIGPNGAGKTTLVDALSGFVPYSGNIHLGGHDLRGLKPHQRVRAGVGRTFQNPQLYDDLTVTENVMVGRAGASGERSPRDLGDVLASLDLATVADCPVGDLSQGRRQLVSIARALVGGPEILLLDEPAGGLDTNESMWLGEQLRHICDNGVTIFLIDHDMHFVFNLCDSVYVLDFGKVIAHGAPAVIQADPTVSAAYLGTTHAEQARS
ncbi:MAG TPA: branched-chain amino acid ABC transporter permease/ATP-binding protein [Microthrixaceae bacterium]|nr:branched-chain amino acid ABC transporter permease/ATP-binding protein [Microthrixaceae bacterium]